MAAGARMRTCSPFVNKISAVGVPSAKRYILVDNKLPINMHFVQF
jgi:hypothetical protein